MGESLSQITEIARNLNSSTESQILRDKYLSTAEFDPATSSSTSLKRSPTVWITARRYRARLCPAMAPHILDER